MARYYLSTPEKFDGQMITLNCSKVQRINQEAKDGIVKFFVTAAGDGWSCDSIIARVKLVDSDAFIKQYGTTAEYRTTNYGDARTRPITGIFTKGTGSSWHLDCTRGWKKLEIERSPGPQL